jgi:hypothetical protein
MRNIEMMMPVRQAKAYCQSGRDDRFFSMILIIIRSTAPVAGSGKGKLEAGDLDIDIKKTPVWLASKRTG